MTVLILAEQDDRPVDLVVTELAEHGIPVFRADTAWFPEELTVDATVDHEGSWRGELRTEHRRVELTDIRAVWSRGPGAFRFSPQLSDGARTYAHREARLGLGGVLSALDVRWVNHPNKSANSSYKPVQLATAARCGLAIPRTLITNDPDALRRLAGECRAGIVHKSLGPNTVTAGGRIEVAFTHRCSPADLADLSAARFTATQTQAWVDKSCEARVVVVGSTMFTVLIRAGSAASEVDWRADYPALSYEWIDTPAAVAAGLSRYVAEMGLAYAAVDFAIDRDGRWIFLESNAAGQYYWLEAHTGAPITTALCDLLSGGGS